MVNWRFPPLRLRQRYSEIFTPQVCNAMLILKTFSRELPETVDLSYLELRKIFWSYVCTEKEKKLSFQPKRLSTQIKLKKRQVRQLQKYC